ncbi:MAG: IS630 family transposase [Gracilibacteraceae bacterium]|nr:IS630 family transposase [Gracilibacteraceae bacterium]
MPRTAKKIECDSATKAELEKISNSQKTEHRLRRRARMVLGCIEGKRIKDIAEETGEQKDVIIKWRDRFALKGIAGLKDEARPGKPIIYDAEWERKVLEKLDEKPPGNLARWDSVVLARELLTSEDAVQRFLQREGIQLARLRTWCISTDPEFAAKAVDIIGLYLNPPENAIVISVDEKPSIQALSRRVGVVKTSNGKIVRAVKSTYKRNGTQNLFAALEVATGALHGKTTKTKKRVDFLGFMDDLLKELDIDEDTEIHAIMDNYCIHKRCDEWLQMHRNVTFHYTPTSASWLNQVEIWFNIMTRKILKGASFDSTSELSEAISGYIDAYNENAQPFVWKKREVRGSQIKDKLSNLRG